MQDLAANAVTDAIFFFFHMKKFVFAMFSLKKNKKKVYFTVCYEKKQTKKATQTISLT